MKAEVNTMLGPKPPEIKLMDEERQAPEKLVRRHNMPQQIALRGRIVLAAADGKNNTQIAREFGVNVETPRLWRNRWLTLSSIAGWRNHSSGRTRAKPLPPNHRSI